MLNLFIGHVPKDSERSSVFFFFNGRGLRILVIKILGIINFGGWIIVKSAYKNFLKLSTVVKLFFTTY